MPSVSKPKQSTSLSPDPRRYKDFFGGHRDTQRSFINDWVRREEREEHGTGGELLPNTKLIVTKHALDKWIANGVGLDLNNFPQNRTKLPNPESEQVYDLIKSDYLKSDQSGKKKIKSQESSESDPLEEKTQNKATFIKNKNQWASRNFMVYPKNVSAERRTDQLMQEDQRRKQPDYDPKAEALAKAQEELATSIKMKVQVKYTQPSGLIKKRMESAGLRFMDKKDIQQTAVKFFETEKLKLEKQKQEAILQKKREEEEKIKRAVKAENDRIMKDKANENRSFKVQQKAADKSNAPTTLISKMMGQMGGVFSKKQDGEKQAEKEAQDKRDLERRAQEKKMFSKIVKKASCVKSKSQAVSMRSQSETRNRIAKLAINQLNKTLTPHQPTQNIKSTFYGGRSNTIAVENLRLKSAFVTGKYSSNTSTHEQSQFTKPETRPTSTLDSTVPVFKNTPFSSARKSPFLSGNDSQLGILDKIRKMGTVPEPRTIQTAPITPVKFVSTMFSPMMEEIYQEGAFDVNARENLSRSTIKRNYKSMAQQEKQFEKNVKSTALQKFLCGKVGIKGAKNPVTLKGFQRTMAQESQYQQTVPNKVRPQTAECTARTVTPQKVGNATFSREQHSRIKTATNHLVNLIKAKPSKPNSNAVSESGNSDDSDAQECKHINDEASLRLSNVINLKQGQRKVIGIGSPAVDERLAKVIRSILNSLKEGPQDKKKAPVPELPSISIPKFEMTPYELLQNITDMKSPSFWLQQALKEENQGLFRYDYALVFYRQGLRSTPTCLTLHYNFGRCNLYARRYQAAVEWFGFGLKLRPRWVNGLVGMAVSYFEMKHYFKAVEHISAARKNFKAVSHNPDDKCLFKEIDILIMQCTMLRAKNDLDGAAKIYKQIGPIVQSYENEEYTDLFLRALLLLLPQNDNRKLTVNLFEQLRDYFKLMHDDNAENAHPLPKSLLISSYIVKENKTRGNVQEQMILKNGLTFGEPMALQWKEYSKSIVNILSTKYFFRRFSKKFLEEKMQNVTVQAYLEEDIIFLKNRIGVIVSGTVYCKNHPGTQLCKPRILFKGTEGTVIGFDEGENCGGLTCDPLSWIICKGKQTEILWFSKDNFEAIWNQQKQDQRRQLYLQQLNMQPFFKCLSDLTKYALVYENMYQDQYFPGELIMSMDSRSAINKQSYSYFQDQKFGYFANLIEEKKHSNQGETQKQQEMARMTALQNPFQKLGLRAQRNQTFIMPMRMKLKIECEDEKCIVHEDGTSEMKMRCMFNRQETQRIRMKSLKGVNYQKSFYDGQKALEPMAKKVSEFFNIDKKQASVKAEDKQNFIIDFNNGEKPLERRSSLKIMAWQSKKQPSMKQLDGIKIDKMDTITLDQKVQKLKICESKYLAQKGNINFNVQQLEFDMVKAATDEKLFEKLQRNIHHYKCRQNQAKNFNEILKQGMEAGDYMASAKILADMSIVTNTKKVLKTEEIYCLKKALEEQITLQNQVQTQQVEPESLNFILEGEAVVYNQKGKQDADGVQMELNMGQVFGESHLTKSISYTTLGEIRAGIRPVHILQFYYDDLDRILTFPERAKLEQFGKQHLSDDLRSKLLEIAYELKVEAKEILRF